MKIDVSKNGLDFSPLHKRIQWYVDENIIPFANTLVMQGDKVVDVHFYGAPGNTTQQTVAEDTIFRMHSSTKIICSIAAMLLWEEGRFSLDDPLEKYIPAFANMRVLKADAKDIDDTVPAEGPIRIRHILSHTAGLSYGFIEPTAVIDQAYSKAGINPMMPGSTLTLETLCDALGKMPLCYQPGAFWRYSFATDVTARLVEVVSGKPFDAFLKERIFKPLGMIDTDFFVPEEKLGRFSTMFLPADPLDPMSACAGPMDAPATTANGKRPAFLSGGGGLMSTLVDYLALSKMIVNNGKHNGKTLIKPETLALMRTNQCAQGWW
ncbi:MAG: beta-lactamase family protein [Gammaproteobacteria bacterium]|nr:beta-lactamase family protein [Gammaproteobacteria bacterium]